MDSKIRRNYRKAKPQNNKKHKVKDPKKHRDGLILTKGIEDKPRKSSLNRRIRNELKRKKKPTTKRYELKGLLSPQAKGRQKLSRQSKGDVNFSDFQSRYSSMSNQKRNLASGLLRNATSPSIEERVFRLKKLGFSEEALRLNNLKKILKTRKRKKGDSQVKPVEKRKTASKRKRNPSERNYRNALFSDLKKSYNLWQVKSDEKESRKFRKYSKEAKRKRAQRSLYNESAMRLKPTINQIKESSCEFVKETINKIRIRRKYRANSPKREENGKENKPNRLKVYRYKNAILVRDSRSGKGVTMYRTGEVFYGGIDADNRTNGLGFFFFPFCGFVYGNFVDNKIHEQGVFKEPDSSFGIGAFDFGIMQDFHIHFKLNEKTKNVDPRKGNLNLQNRNYLVKSRKFGKC